MYDRILTVSLAEFDKLTERFKWRFYEIIDEDKIRVEVPKGDNEALVLYVGNVKEYTKQLDEMGFIKQEIKQWRDW
jgi:hypothetical protein